MPLLSDSYDLEYHSRRSPSGDSSRNVEMPVLGRGHSPQDLVKKNGNGRNDHIYPE